MSKQRGRHHDAARVRSVGLHAALAPVLRSRPWARPVPVVAATLVDPASGLLLDGFTDDPAITDLELLAACHADLANAAAQLADDHRGVLVHSAGGRHDIVRLTPDPYGGALAVALVVRGARRHADRALDRLLAMPVGSLAAGPELRSTPTPGTPTPDRSRPHRPPRTHPERRCEPGRTPEAAQLHSTQEVVP